MLRLILSIGLGLFMAGCVTQADLIASDRATCAQIGFMPDTPEFRNCVLQLESARLAGQYGYWR